MKIKQLSVFLENKVGGINDVTHTLAEAGINMSAFSIAENADFGIMRVIVCDVDAAMKALKEHHFAVSLTDVVCLNCPNTPGALSKILDYLAEQEVFIEYMYAFSQDQIASVVIRPNDIDKCVQVLQEHKLDLICSDRLYRL